MFLGKSFFSYGIEVLKFYQNGNCKYNNPMEVIFPRLTKCNFSKYGPSGTIQSIDAMCILPQNVLNDKIYLFLWIWFFIIASISVLSLIYKIAIIIQILIKKPILFNTFNFTNNKQIISTLVSKFQVSNSMLILNLVKLLMT